MENIRTHLDIYKCAREAREPTWLSRYKDIDVEAVFHPQLSPHGIPKAKPQGVSLTL